MDKNNFNLNTSEWPLPIGTKTTLISFWISPNTLTDVQERHQAKKVELF